MLMGSISTLTILFGVSPSRSHAPAASNAFCCARSASASAAELQVSPMQTRDLRHAEASGIKHLQQHAIAFRARAAYEEVDLHLGDDALGECGATVAGVGPDRDGGAGVEGRITQAMRIAEQRLHAEHVLAPHGLGHVAGDAAQRVASVLDGGSAQAA